MLPAGVCRPWQPEAHERRRVGRGVNPQRPVAPEVRAGARGRHVRVGDGRVDAELLEAARRRRGGSRSADRRSQDREGDSSECVRTSHTCIGSSAPRGESLRGHSVGLRNVLSGSGLLFGIRDRRALGLLVSVVLSGVLR